MAQKILITGMSGLIGGVVRRHLEDRYQLTALNRREVSGIECHLADIADLEAIQPAFTDVDTVIHLAALARGDAPFDDILHHNIIGTYNVFEAARRAGVERIIAASSGAAVSNWERDMPYQALVQGRYDETPSNWENLTHETPVRPTGLYGCSKVWLEALGRHFSDTFDLSVICLRIGGVNQEDKPRDARQFSVWCSQRDIAQMVERCIVAPASLRYDIFYAVSDNQWSYRDVEHARQQVGYEPRDAAEDHR